MATQFLSTGQTTSDLIEKPGSGDIIVYFFGAMHADEKWVIEAAMESEIPANRDFRAVHAIDGLDDTGDDINKWLGPRDNDRQFFFPVEKSFVYRARKVFGPTSTVGPNTTVTAYWAIRTTRIYR